ncbi:MAG: asparagine synthase (glutamine-hydrolyzing) [Candidatus Latescibacterota bacterium]
MCGIAGWAGFGGAREEVLETLGRMTDIMVHRGPDDLGLYADDVAALGMRRLSIIDVAGGAQPIHSEDGSLVLVCNGEIYNYQDLVRDLEGRGHVFSTHSDVESILHLYEERGDACVEALRGMYAFALWDRRRQRLLVARDRLGIKPLYYAVRGGELVFASEIKALLVHPGVEARTDLEALSHFLSLKYVPAPRTLFAAIVALPPGHLLTWSAGRVQERGYWDLSFAPDPELGGDEEECAQRLADVLRESVRLHLRSDVPFGAFLSGGLDSSLVVGLMSEFLSEPVRTYSVGYEADGDGASELPYARTVAHRHGTQHHEVLVGPGHFTGLMETVVWHLDQPIADQAALATYVLSCAAARDVKMVLTGEGGDELFAGYARYSGERLAPLFGALPGAARRMMLLAARRVHGHHRSKLALYALCQRDLATRLVNWFPLLNDEAKHALLAEPVLRAVATSPTRSVVAEQLARTDASVPLHRMLYLDTKLWLPDDLLARGDKTSMAASLEGRVPLLDHVVVEFAARLPPHLKLRGLTRKYLLRRVARTVVPPEVLHRPKKGFPTPLASWIRGPARPFVRDLLSPEAVHRRGLFNPASVARILDRHDSGAAPDPTVIWSLLNIELWHRAFIDRDLRRLPAHRPVARAASAARESIP